MKRIAVFAASIVGAIGLIEGQQPAATNVADLVAKHVQAKGGAEALKALQSIRLTGKNIVMGGRLELAVTELKKRPSSIRQEATMQGLTAIEAYDGAEAWKIMPFQGRKDPEKMSPDDAKELIEGGEIDGPLVDWQAKGSTVDYLGTEDVEGTQAHKLRVVRKNGDVTIVYLDPDAFLEIREVTQRVEHGAQVETETDYGDYEKVGGVFLPMSIESGRKGSSDKQKIIFEKSEANVPVDDSAFHFPAAK